MTGRIHNDPDSFHTFFSSTSYCQKHNGSTGRHAQIRMSLAFVVINNRLCHKERDSSTSCTNSST